MFLGSIVKRASWIGLLLHCTYIPCYQTVFNVKILVIVFSCLSFFLSIFFYNCLQVYLQEFFGVCWRGWVQAIMICVLCCKLCPNFPETFPCIDWFFFLDNCLAMSITTWVKTRIKLASWISLLLMFLKMGSYNDPIETAPSYSRKCDRVKKTIFFNLKTNKKTHFLFFNIDVFCTVYKLNVLFPGHL